MSGPGSFADAPAIAITAPESKVGGSVAPRTNNALMLAASLSDLNPKLAQLGGQLVKENQDTQSAAAKKLAQETGGQDLAEAVRTGKISPTQNPYFIQDYSREAAYVKAGTELSQLTVDSQSWAEKNDHVAFQKKYTEALAEIGQKYNTSEDTQQGFMAAAAPAQQQAFAANTAEVAGNIEKDRQANLSTMITQGVLSIQSQHGGAASPQQLMDGLDTTKQHYISTGGTEVGWNKLLYNGVTSAAYNSGDPSLLDKLPQSVKDQPGIADQIATDKYHIMQDHSSVLRQQAQDTRDRITVEGQSIATKAMQRYGNDALIGKIDFATLLKDNPGADPLSVSAALNSMQATVADNQALHIAKTRALEQTGTGASEVLSLHTEASTLGISPELNAKVGALVATNQMSAQDGQQIIDKAIETTKAKNSGGGMFPQPGKGLDVAAKAVYGSTKPYADLRKSTDAEAIKLTQWINQSARVAGNSPIPTAEVSHLQSVVSAASVQWLDAHPGDFVGARQAARAIQGIWFQENAEKYTKPKAKAK